MARYWDYVGTLVEFQYTEVHGFNEIIIICFYARRCLWHYIRALEEYCIVETLWHLERTVEKRASSNICCMV